MGLQRGGSTAVCVSAVSKITVFRKKREGLMKISTEIASAAALVGEEKAVEYTAKAGFDAWDFSMLIKYVLV